MATRKSKSSKTWNSCGTTFFFFTFFAIGSGLTWFLAIAPTLKTREAANWREVECLVQQIGVQVHQGDGDTYSPEVTFSYSFQGQPYTGKQFWFGSGSYGDRTAIERAIAPFQAGGEYPCYVNPRDPTEAVLTRQVAAHTWLGWLFGGIFTLVGLGGMIAGIQSNRKSKADAKPLSHVPKDLNRSLQLNSSPDADDRNGDSISDELPQYDLDATVCPTEEDRPDEPMILALKASRSGIAIGCWIFSSIWNAIVWTVGYFAFQDLHWLAFAFIGLFLLVGVLVILYSIYTTLQVFNPRTTLVCSQRNLYAGSEFELSWLHQGNSSSIAELLIELEGEESATYRHGTTSRTDKSLFFKQIVVKTSDPTEIAKGFRLVSLPLDTMHTFRGARNKIVWNIRVRGKIRFWPDIHDEFEITIYPPLVEGEMNVKN